MHSECCIRKREVKMQAQSAKGIAGILNHGSSCQTTAMDFRSLIINAECTCSPHPMQYAESECKEVGARG